MKTIYIGVRTTKTLEKILNRRVSRLNEGLSKHLRSSCLKLGIKKTEQRKKLLFVPINEDELQNLVKNNCHLLVTVDSEKMSEILNEVNSNYPSRMDCETSEKYKEQLKTELTQSIEVIGQDKNIRKKPLRKNNYLYKNHKLGKLIYNTDGYKRWYGELEDFFNYIFHKKYVISFEYRKDPQCHNLETFEWDRSKEITRQVFKEYIETYQLMVKWSNGDKYSRVHTFKSIESYVSRSGFSHDGFSNDSVIETTKPLKELFDEFRNQYDREVFTDSIMNSYSPYGTYGSFFEDYEEVTWEESENCIRNTLYPILDIIGEDFKGYDTLNRERVRDLLLSKRGKDWNKLEHGLWIKKYFLKEEVTKQDIVDFWWEDKKWFLNKSNPKITQEELEKEREEFDRFSWSSESRLKEIYERLNPQKKYNKVG